MPFATYFQRFLSDKLTDQAYPTSTFIDKYGSDYSLIFRLSAKHELDANEICGPTVFRKDKDVEFTIFVPFRKVTESNSPTRTALGYLFDGFHEVYEQVGIDGGIDAGAEQELTNAICRDRRMFDVTMDVAKQYEWLAEVEN